VIYTPALDVLLLERVDHPGFWQSVTGSLDSEDEAPLAACVREVGEETGLVAAPDDFDDWNMQHTYPIYPHWRARYAPGVTHNTEHVFGLGVNQAFDPQLSPREHRRARWLGWRDAADACFSWTNAQAIHQLARRAG